ncbi:MarR family winged helix-turn-helix transcriptional regulator [Microbacterium hominis]|uniref:MarR family transcriptional regulator n=1 Tax=Microbacterium hominis TaxID=162426 RepID=A0A7D4PZB3_9MICO|nr:MarR family transcriptional regulator [Microbacterium hominis]QKJ18018.1 MarR family transcriptional regulator [Microbacterium hominis]
MHEPLLLDRLLQIADLFQRDMAREYEGTPLSAARMGVLWTVHHAGPVAQHAIAETLNVSARNITALVDALEDAGYVTRVAHPTDRRARLVALTPVGEKVMERTVREHAALNATLLDAVPASDRDRVASAVAAIAERLAQLVAEAADDEAEAS